MLLLFLFSIKLTVTQKVTQETRPHDDDDERSMCANEQIDI